MQLLVPHYYHISVMGAIHLFSSGDPKPSKVRDSEIWEGFQTSFF